MDVDLDDIKPNLDICNVPGCNGKTRRTQYVCDSCRKRFIDEPGFRRWLVSIGCVPD